MLLTTFNSFQEIKCVKTLGGGWRATAGVGHVHKNLYLAKAISISISSACCYICGVRLVLVV